MKRKRKLIGFIAGEKGGIGKLQALALGVAGLIATGLIPKVTQAWDNFGWSGDKWDDWDNWGNWSGDWSGDWVGNWSGDWSGDWPSDWPANAPPNVDDVKAS